MNHHVFQHTVTNTTLMYRIGWKEEIICKEHIPNDSIEEDKYDCQYGRQNNGLDITSKAAHHITQCLVAYYDIKQLQYRGKEGGRKVGKGKREGRKVRVREEEREGYRVGREGEREERG